MVMLSCAADESGLRFVVSREIVRRVASLDRGVSDPEISISIEKSAVLKWT